MSVAITPGSRFASYRVEALVGRGGMGVVYRATDLSLERPVALKLIAPELADDERFRGRFLKESRLAASLDHPNVIPIYDAGEHDGHLYLAMRYVEGSDLKTMLDGERSGSWRQSGRFGCWPRSPVPWMRPTGADSCTAMSSRRTCSSTRTSTPT